jgi:hypothetical protein
VVARQLEERSVRGSPGWTARIALAAAVVGLVAAGCTGGDEDDPPATDASPGTEEPTPDDEADDEADDGGDLDGSADDADDDADDADDAGATDEAQDGEATVQVFFTNPDRGPDPQVFPVERTVAAPAVLRGALEELLAGPTSAEADEGYWSFFSSATADQLDDVSLADGTAEVSFSAELPEIIPNASTSAGSAVLLAELDATTTQFETVDEAIYSLEGDVDAFYEWLQLAYPR